MGVDPNLFHLDWDRLSEVLVGVVVLAFLLERALAVVFEHRYFVEHLQDKGIKEFIAVGVALAVCLRWNFDAVSMILLTDKTTVLGEFITACIIAGGSKGAIRLFRDVLGIKSEALRQREARKAREAASGGGGSGT